MTGWCSRGSRLRWESPRLVWDELGALLETRRAHVVHCRAYVVRDARAAHALRVCAAALCLVRFSLCLEYSCLQ